MSDTLLVLYGVRNHEGKWFRAKGYGGSGESWVDNISKAKLYGKIGPARSCVTFYANSQVNKAEHNRLPVPELVELHVTKIVIPTGEGERVKKAQVKKKKEIEQAKIRQKQYEIESAERQLRQAQERLKKLNN